MIDAYVVGDSLPALTAALDLAEVGLKVRVGATNADIPQHPLDDAGGSLAELCERLAAPVTEGGPRHDHLGPVTYEPDRTALRGRGGAWSAAPTPSVLGIPAVPLSRESTQLLGGGTAFRAYLDRIKPLLTIGKTQWLDALVNARIGVKARSILVDPVIREQFGRESSDVEVSIAAPGLNETMSRTGSLTGAALAYAERNVARETKVAPQAGWRALRESLIERLTLYSVEVVDECVTGVTRVGDGAEEAFHLTVAGAAEGSRDPDDALHSREIVARSLIIAAPEVIREEDMSPRVSGNAQRSPSGSGLLLHALEASHLVPGQHRVYAEVGIRTPEWANSLQAAVHGAAGSDRKPTATTAPGGGTEVDSALLTVKEDRPGDRRDAADTTGAWSVRVHLRDDAGPRAVLRGPVIDSARTNSVSESMSSDALERVLQGADIESDPEATWHVAWETAPHATHTDRDRQRDALDTFRASHPTILPVGAALHGGDRSAALAHARHGAIELRRQLLGLSA